MGKRVEALGDELKERSDRRTKGRGFLAVELLVWNLDQPLAQRSDSFYELIASLHGIDLRYRRSPKGRLRKNK